MRQPVTACARQQLYVCRGAGAVRGGERQTVILPPPPRHRRGRVEARVQLQGPLLRGHTPKTFASLRPACVNSPPPHPSPQAPTPTPPHHLRGAVAHTALNRDHRCLLTAALHRATDPTAAPHCSAPLSSCRVPWHCRACTGPPGDWCRRLQRAAGALRSCRRAWTTSRQQQRGQSSGQSAANIQPSLQADLEAGVLRRAGAPRL